MAQPIQNPLVKLINYEKIVKATARERGRAVNAEEELGSFALEGPGVDTFSTTGRDGDIVGQIVRHWYGA